MPQGHANGSGKSWLELSFGLRILDEAITHEVSRDEASRNDTFVTSASCFHATWIKPTRFYNYTLFAAARADYANIVL